jgi:hypothetical protein
MGKIEGFSEGVKRFEKIKRAIFRQTFTNAAFEMMKDAIKSNDATLTGNTITSFVIGLYEDGKIYRIVDAYDIPNVQPPTRKKITKNEGKHQFVVLSHYRTHKKTVATTHTFVEVSDEYGEDTSRKFLLNYKNSSKGFSLVMATGTEYSEYLESKRRLNVLQETYDYVESIFKRHLKNIQL